MTNIQKPAEKIQSVVLKTEKASLTLLNFGATTVDWRVSSGSQKTPMILGFENLEDYLTSPYFFGAIAGRVSNRIGLGRYPTGDGFVELDQNEGQTTLHGGSRSLSVVFWDLEKLSDTQARFTYQSPDGENGFPGNAQIEVTVTLFDQQLRYDFIAEVDAETPISLAQHNYYNFGGTKDIWGYKIQSPTHQVLEKNAINVSTGAVLDTSGGPMDFREFKHLRAFAEAGLDGHFVFDETNAANLRQIADIRAPSGLGIKMFSDQGGAQLYTAHALPDIQGGLDGALYGRASGLCFEPQGHPNAVNVPEFPSIMVSPEQPYRQSLLIEAVGLEP